MEASTLTQLLGETTINIMAISRDQGAELEEALHQIEAESKTQVVYIVDSFGSLYQEPIELLVKKFKSILKKLESKGLAAKGLQAKISQPAVWQSVQCLRQGHQQGL